MKTPNGIEKPDDEARQEWQELYAPLEGIGFRATGYAPGVLFRCPDTEKHFDLPVAAIQRINKALDSPAKRP